LILKTILKRAFERIAGAADGRATVLLRDGRQRESAGDDAGAERQYRAVLAIQPGHAAAVLALGSLLGRCDRVTEAEVLLQQAVALAPQSADAHAALGNVHLMRGDFGAAQEAYSRALQLAPSNPAAVFNAGFLCQCRMDFAGALERYEHAYNLAPGMPGLLRRLTLMRLELGQYEAAGSLVDAVLSVRPDDADAQFSMGLVLLQTGRPQSALVHFGRACAQRGYCPARPRPDR
jgi:Flp pilus assembly protein TadD